MQKSRRKPRLSSKYSQSVILFIGICNDFQDPDRFAAGELSVLIAVAVLLSLLRNNCPRIRSGQSCKQHRSRYIHSTVTVHIAGILPVNQLSAIDIISYQKAIDEI